MQKLSLHLLHTPKLCEYYNTSVRRGTMLAQRCDRICQSCQVQIITVSTQNVHLACILLT